MGDRHAQHCAAVDAPRVRASASLREHSQGGNGGFAGGKIKPTKAPDDADHGPIPGSLVVSLTRTLPLLSRSPAPALRP